MKVVLLVVMVAMASAGNLRQSKQSMKKNEMVALVNDLAVKYDCHVQEANLQDTLKTILTKNEAAQTKAGTDYIMLPRYVIRCMPINLAITTSP